MKGFFLFLYLWFRKHLKLLDLIYFLSQCSALDHSGTYSRVCVQCSSHFFQLSLSLSLSKLFCFHSIPCLTRDFANQVSDPTFHFNLCLFNYSTKSKNSSSHCLFFNSKRISINPLYFGSSLWLKFLNSTTTCKLQRWDTMFTNTRLDPRPHSSNSLFCVAHC